MYHKFTTDLQSRWDVDDEGEVSDLLGVEIERSESHVTLRQTRYIERLAEEHLPDGLPAHCQKNSPPCLPDLPEQVLQAVTSTSEVDPVLVKQYQSLVGALLYCATNTRPDVAYAVGLLCRAMARPTPALYEAAQRVLTYLVRHKGLGLRYEPDGKPLEGMSDSDWAVRHSTTGWVFRLGAAAVSWASKRQPTIALSSCEAEIMAASEAAKEASYLDGFLAELGLKGDEPVSLAVDNTGARDLAYNPEHHTRTKHIERRHFFVRELVELGRVVVPFVASDRNLADFFTKPLSAKRFYPLRDLIMNVPRDADASAGGQPAASDPVAAGA